MSLWTIRNRQAPGEEKQLPAELLFQNLQAGFLDDSYEFRPPDWQAWITLAEAMELLQTPGLGAASATSLPAEDADSAAGATSAVVADTSPPPLPPVTLTEPRGVPDMPLRGPSPRGNSAGEEDELSLEMTPLIDMTFLLLIFFMVASTMSAMGSLQLPKAVSGDAENPDNRVVLVLDFPDGLRPDERGQLSGSKFIVLGDAQIYLTEKPGEMIPADRIEAVLRREFERKPSAQFILQANRKMPTGVVREVLKMAKQAGARESMVGVTMPR